MPAVPRERLTATAFMTAALRVAIERAPRRLGPFRTSRVSYMAKLWTGSKDLHYEIWRRSRPAAIEVGLHFESDGLTNARLLGAFRARRAEIRRHLGRGALLEEWDRGWARVYETLPLGDDPATARRSGERLAAYVAALEPMLREELPAETPWRMAG